MSIRSSIRSYAASIFSPDIAPPLSPTLGFMEAQGRVIEAINPNHTGRVNLHGVSWLARCADTLIRPLPVNTPIQVIDRVGLTLLVRPLITPVTACADDCSMAQVSVTPSPAAINQRTVA